MSELEELRERHRKCESCYSYGELAHCDYCTTGMVRPYPCDTAVALAEVERLRGELRVAEARIAGAKALLTALSDQ